MIWGYDADDARSFTQTPSDRPEYFYDSPGQLVSIKIRAAGEVSLEHDVEGRLAGTVLGHLVSRGTTLIQMLPHRKAYQEGVSTSTQVACYAVGRVADWSVQLECASRGKR